MDKDDLQATVDRLEALGAADAHIGDYYATMSKKAALEAEHSKGYLTAFDEYATVQAQLAAVAAQRDTPIVTPSRRSRRRSPVRYPP